MKWRARPHSRDDHAGVRGLALTRLLARVGRQLRDDGAAPAVTRPQAGDSCKRDAIRRGGIGQVAVSQEGTAPITSGETAEQAPASAPHQATHRSKWSGISAVGTTSQPPTCRPSRPLE